MAYIKLKNIEFFSFSAAPSELKEAWQESLVSVIKGGNFIGGSIVEEFEDKWSKYIGVKHAIGVGNGYDALVLALRSLNVGAGDLVAVPSHTFIATWLAVAAVGAKPIGIDCDANGLMDLAILESLPQQIKAVIPVHMHGQMVDMDRLMSWGTLRNVSVIEDCAQAQGATLYGRKAGSWGHVNAFSFYPSKNLGALGDAGAVVTNDSEIAKKIRSLSNYGTAPGEKYKYLYQGINSRLDPMQASILIVNLQYLDTWNYRRNEIAHHYIKNLVGLNIPILNTDLPSVWHHFIVLPQKRNEAQEYLSKAGVQTGIHYPMCAEDIYAQLLDVPRSRDLEARHLANHTLSLPISPWMENNEIDYVIEKVLEKSLGHFSDEPLTE
jgi:dTDP-4-amino-4,6-dideoxygalactose transaminase